MNTDVLLSDVQFAELLGTPALLVIPDKLVLLYVLPIKVGQFIFLESLMPHSDPS